jgi:hypothetical protein
MNNVGHTPATSIRIGYEFAPSNVEPDTDFRKNACYHARLRENPDVGTVFPNQTVSLLIEPSADNAVLASALQQKLAWEATLNSHGTILTDSDPHAFAFYLAVCTIYQIPGGSAPHSTNFIYRVEGSPGPAARQST